MKKKFIFCILIILFFEMRGFTQNVGLKTYFDYSRNFSGVAGSVFLGDFKDFPKTVLDSKIKFFSEHFVEVKKLTKSNNWLLEKAMDEWDYQKGEIYFVILGENEYAENGIILIVQIDLANHYVWNAWEVSEEEMESLFDSEW